jgi:ABC-2 type transport system permease protein
LRDPQPVALVLVVTLIAGCSALAVWLAGRRDLGASVLRERAGRVRDTWWLVGPTSLAVWLSRTGAVSWLTGLALMAVVEGLVARSASTILTSSPSMAATMRRLGVRQGSEGYLGAAFFFVVLLIAIIAATQIVSMRDEEASGRLDNLLVRPVRRVTWLAGRLSVSLGLIVLAGITSGLFTWVGAVSRHTGVGLYKLLEAGLNAAVPGIFILGAGALTLGLRPRLSAVVTYGIVAYSFLISIVGSLIKGSDWIRNSSLFSHIALAPAAKPDWSQAAALVFIGLGAAVVGAIAFQKRDVEYA